ncbi:MAG: hypothetical protein AB7S26_11750 [Sandaracinaceae bacterium]
MKLRVDPSATPLAAEWERLRETALRRGPTVTLSPAPIDVRRFRPRAVDAMRAAWSRRAIDEHRSATVFSGLLPQLIEAELPIDVLAVALRMAMDELHHGALSFAVARALGAEAELEIDDASEAPAAHRDATPRVRALRNVLYASCISETVSVALTAAERERTDEPYVREVLDQLFADETLHARFGWICVALMVPRLEPTERAEVDAYLPYALTHHERAIASRLVGGAGLDALEREDCARLGGLDPDEARAVLFDTTRDVIAQRLRELGLGRAE